MKKVFGLLAAVFLLSVAVVVVRAEDGDILGVSTETVADVGSFGDFFQRISERFELLVARSDERKLELEEKFAARREAQMERLEALPDEHPRKQELIEKLEKRHEKHLQNIEKRAERHKENLGERYEQIKNRVELRKERIKDAEFADD